jgi:hypothetical protein
MLKTTICCMRDDARCGPSDAGRVYRVYASSTLLQCVGTNINVAADSRQETTNSTRHERALCLAKATRRGVAQRQR